MPYMYCSSLRVRASSFLIAGFRSGVGEWGSERDGRKALVGKSRDMKSKYNAYHSSLESPETVWPHVLGGRAVETCKKFPEQNRSTFLLTSASDHLSSRYSRVYPL